MLGCSVGNLKSKLYKAKMRIRELLVYSPEARLEMRKGQALANKRAKAACENWGLPKDAVMPPARLMPEWIRPTA